MVGLSTIMQLVSSVGPSLWTVRNTGMFHATIALTTQPVHRLTMVCPYEPLWNLGPLDLVCSAGKAVSRFTLTHPMHRLDDGVRLTSLSCQQRGEQAFITLDRCSD